MTNKEFDEMTFKCMECKNNINFKDSYPCYKCSDNEYHKNNSKKSYFKNKFK